MKTTEFNKPISGSKLAENFEKQFGTRINLAKYDREQLEDIRNKLRTRIFQQEGSSKFNDLLTNETYQKDKAMLELLNTRIKEMLGEQMQKLRDRMDQLSEGKKGFKEKVHPKGAKGAKPDFLDLDKDGNKAEPMKKAAKDAKVKEGFPTVDDAKKAHAEKGTTSMKVGDKQKSSTGGEITKTATGLKHTAGKNYGGQDAPKAPDSDKKAKKVKEAFPTVADAKKAHDEKGTAGMKVGQKQKSSTGGEITKTATGLKHTAGKNYGGQDAPKAPDSDKKAKKVKEGMKHPTDCDCNECMMQEGAKPDFLDLDKDGNKAEPMKKAATDKKKKSVKESQYKHNVRFVNESIQFLLQEDEEGKAKTITAAGDMVNDFTSWMQRVGQYQTKAIIELSDEIRAEFGQAEAEQFKNTVGPALSATLETLTQQREAISNAVATLAGEAAPEEPMGMEPDMDTGMEPGMDSAGPDEMNPPAGDEFSASDAAVGGDQTSGRELRESREQRRARKLSEAHSIISKLAK